MYMCVCKALTESDVRRVVQEGATTAERLISGLGLHDARCCGRCVREVDRYVTFASQVACTPVAVAS
jgi:bacterioferritin-associated ferredoxin